MNPSRDHTLLSIITICFNDLKNLRKTIESVAYSDHIEHLIIDGGSKDGTIDYLNTLDNPNLTWISESDNGIYDAMNKGLIMATGDYVIFMNSGDLFYDDNTSPSILKILDEERPDILYGDAMLIDDQGNNLGLRSVVTTRSLPQSLSWRDMKAGMLVCHQSFIVKRSIAPPYIQNNLSADIDWQIKCLTKASKIKFINIPISKFLIGGTSQKQHLRSLIDRFRVMKDHYGSIPTIWYHLLILFRAAKFNLVHP